MSTMMGQHSMLSKTAVIIPVLNEELSIGKVLDDLPDVMTVVVCDNGSTDRSCEIARSRNAVVLFEPQRGYGAACLKGLRYLQELPVDQQPDVIGFIDGDYSDFPEEMAKLVAEIENGPYDMVIGSRTRGDREQGAMPLQAVFGNKLACFLMWLFWGAKYTDLGPFRVIRFDSLKRLGMSDTNFGWTIEMQIKAVEEKLRTREVPVSYRCRLGESKISGTIMGSIRAGYKILLTIFRYRFWRPR